MKNSEHRKNMKNRKHEEQKKRREKNSIWKYDIAFSNFLIKIKFAILLHIFGIITSKLRP